MNTAPLAKLYVSVKPKKTLHITLGKGTLDVFQNHQFVVLKKAELSILKPDLLAQGLYAYFASHSHPHPIKASTLKKLLGHTSMQESKWLLKLKGSLERLKLATKWFECHLAESNKVIVKRCSTPAKQQKQEEQTPLPNYDDDI